ncbi:bidirectional sugar transporter NEC1-like [Rutidosis leptorrhynchoides]|uniref:bidirectional sugar transporter NEC1-like n=1 Tax=Rutidosis leptorrhynchoides TaxID=125765 RepID=UPI003A99B83C
MAHLTLAFGLLGNIVSSMVFLAPIPTFYKVYKRKSTEGFQSAPYVVGLMESLKLIVLLIIVAFGLIVGLTQFFASGVTRGVIVGWICLIFSLCVFVAPLGVLRQVIKTKSVEYMPILLSVALTLSAVMWFFYGLLLGDINIAIPNVLGFTFGIIQMILYFVYKNKNPVIDEKTFTFEQKIYKVEDQKIADVKDQQIIDVAKLNTLLNAEILPVSANNPHTFDHVAVEPQVLKLIRPFTPLMLKREIILRNIKRVVLISKRMIIVSLLRFSFFFFGIF